MRTPAAVIWWTVSTAAITSGTTQAAGLAQATETHTNDRLPPQTAPWPDISTVAPDLLVPSLSAGSPAPGRRVLEKLEDWQETAVYHVVYLPSDWEPDKCYPVLVEYNGNGGYTNKFGDVCTGRPEDSKLGYGLSAGLSFIWVCVPYLNQAGDDLALNWWGDKPDQDPRPTLRYCRALVNWMCKSYGADANRIFLCGFSRGAIACNYLGLNNDEIAGLWCGFIAYSHYDGVRQWPYPGADSGSALTRLLRLNGRPQLICGEAGQIAETRRYLDHHLPEGNFLFVPTGFRNHNDAWILRPSPARSAARAWLKSNANIPVRN